MQELKIQRAEFLMTPEEQENSEDIFLSFYKFLLNKKVPQA